MTLNEFNRLGQRDFENGAVLDGIAAVFKDRDQLQAIVDKLPKCWRLEGGKLVRDVPVVPDMPCWCVSHSGAVTRWTVDKVGHNSIEVHCWPNEPRYITPEDIYSTREATEQEEKSDA